MVGQRGEDTGEGRTRRQELRRAGPGPLSRQVGRAHQVAVDSFGRLAALGDRPDDQGLPALHVARGEDARHVRHPVLVPPDIAAFGELYTELTEHAILLRPQKTHGEEDEIRLYLERAVRDLAHTL